MKKRKFVVGLFVVAMLLQSSVFAGYLPESSFWQGSRTYTQNNVNAVVDYAVYNTASSTYHNQRDGLVDGFVNPGTGKYIYAYQIVANYGTTLPPIATFELLGGNSANGTGIGSQSDGADGIIPTNDGATFVWKFENGVFVATKHSAFMVFSTNAAPRAGSFKITTDTGDEPAVPGDDPDQVPEPATMAMLAMGAIGLARKLKK